VRKIAPCLWFDNQAEEAANFYVSVYSRITAISHYGEGMSLPKGTVLEVSFELNGEDFLALNGGPIFTFSPAISFW
jgi:predicted 3-demethylubiquinone-9 3-methyltransferase (glyoxalase superfamily)